MTSYEHALVGVDGALALGLHRRWGWPIVALAGCASVLPDWDGLTICLGINVYGEGHRVWGHNLLLTFVVPAVVGAVFWRFELITRTQQALGRRWSMFAIGGDQTVASGRTRAGLLVWIAVSVVAAYIHLLADWVYSVGRDLPVWGVPFLWPFSAREYAWPMVPWGDVGASVILAIGMFAMLRWLRRTQAIAGGTLGVLVAYIGVRGCFL